MDTKLGQLVWMLPRYYFELWVHFLGNAEHMWRTGTVADYYVIFLPTLYDIIFQPDEYALVIW
jgi:hypothetical protein